MTIHKTDSPLKNPKTFNSDKMPKKTIASTSNDIFVRCCYHCEFHSSKNTERALDLVFRLHYKTCHIGIKQEHGQGIHLSNVKSSINGLHYTVNL